MATKEKTVRVPKGKTPRQLAQRAANIKAAQERLARLQAEQRGANEAKKAATARYAYEAAYVQAAFNGPHAVVFRRWLKHRIPTFQRVHSFFSQRPKFEQPLSTNKAA